MNPVAPPTEWLPQFKLVRLFNDQECAEIIAAAQAKGFVKGTRLTDEGHVVLDSDYRRCNTMAFAPGEPTYDLIVNRILERKAFLNQRYEFDLYAELEKLIPKVMINHYSSEERGRIGYHTDLGHFESTDDRKLSISVLLNDPAEYEGGEFWVYDGAPKQPFEGGKPVGTAAIFPSFSVHSVSEVIKGDRWSLVIWLRGPRFR